MDTFTQKLKAGLQGEEIARVYLESLGKKVEALPGFNRGGDLLVNGHPVEVKTDIRAFDTGNVCIEHRSLETHTAKFYIWVVPHIYKVTADSLQFIQDTWPDKLPGGDDARSTTLLPYMGSLFQEHFIPIKRK